MKVIKMRGQRLVVLGIIVGIVIVLILAILFIPTYIEKQTIEYKAWERAKELVRDELKAPATAKFPSYDKKLVHNDGYGEWEVNNYNHIADYGWWSNHTYTGTRLYISSYVDAENSYGALIRNEFTVCIIRTDEGGIYNHDGWVTDYVDID